MLKSIDTTTQYIILGGAAFIVIALLLRRAAIFRVALPIWLTASVIGMVVGVGISLGAMNAMGYHWDPEPSALVPTSMVVPTDGAMQSRSAMSPMMGAMGGGRGGRGGGGNDEARAQRTLPDLVGRLNLLTGGLHVQLSDAQVSKLLPILVTLDQAKELDAKAAQEQEDKLRAALTPDQLAALDAIALPRRGGAGAAMGGRGGMGGGGRPGPAGKGAALKRPGGGPGAAPGGEGANENPFKQTENAKHLSSLRDRLAGSATPNAGGTKS